MDSLTFIRRNSFQNKNNRKNVEVLKFNDICVSCSSTKTNLGDELFKLRKSKFEHDTFSQ